MTDNQTAQDRVGSIFNYVLVASERVKEIHRERKAKGLNGLSMSAYSKLEKTHVQVSREIEEGTVGVEYLLKIRDREQKSNHKMR